MNARADFPPLDDERDVAMLRVPPHSIEAETGVLGALLWDNAAWDRVGDLLQDSDFYRYEHRLIFGAMRDLLNANKPADVITVFERLDAAGKAGDCGGLVYLGELSHAVPSARHVRQHAEIVRERSVRRRLITAADEVAASAFKADGTLESLLDVAQQKVFAISEAQVAARDDWQSADAGMAALLDRMQAQCDGTADQDYQPTGLHALDDRLDGGIRPGELIVIGARPSMGKTALGLTIALNIAKDAAKPTGFFSMEMPVSQVHCHMLSMVSRVHLSLIKRAERLKDFHWPDVTKATEVIRKSPIFVSDTSNLNINQVRARARGLQRRHGTLGCLVVDYLGLMAGTDSKMPRAYQLEEVTKGLKALAKELRIPIILLAQVKRTVEERTDQMPMLSDLRDSGSVEQDADIVMFVHREYKAKPGIGEEWKYHAKVNVAKIRDGEPGPVDLMFIGENVRFQNWPAETALPTSAVRTAKKGADL